LKVIIDTNVLISGVFFGGPPSRILKSWGDNRIELIVSEEIFEEYKLVCERLHGKYPNIDFAGILDLIGVNAHFYQPVELNIPITIDPDDDKFFKCALASDVKMIISGDKHLLAENGYQEIEVLTPTKFIAKYLHK